MINPMNKIEKLIAELCPEGVEWKTLGEVAEFKYGFTDKAKDKGNVRFIRITDINENGKLRDYDRKFLDLKEENKSYLLSQGDILLARTGATYGKTMLFDENYQAIYASFLIRIRFQEKNILPSYYWHFSQSHFYWEQAIKLVGGGAQPQFNANVLKVIKIPIPPLAIQQEIVKILDTFTTLEAELEAELEARKKQYEYYRDELLTFGEDVVLSTLSDVAHFMNGKGHEKHIDENGRYIVVNSKFVSTEGRVKKYSVKQISPVSKNDILMVMSDLPNGKALAKCFYVDENDKYTLNQRICALTVKDNKKLNSKFLCYILNRNRQLLRYDSGADQTNLRKDDILNIEIPIPSFAEQKRIVAILDKFDALVNDISVGLPAELNARSKQYEYYRGKLLTFEPLEKDHANQ